MENGGYENYSAVSYPMLAGPFIVIPPPPALPQQSFCHFAEKWYSVISDSRLKEKKRKCLSRTGTWTRALSFPCWFRSRSGIEISSFSFTISQQMALIWTPNLQYRLKIQWRSTWCAPRFSFHKQPWFIQSENYINRQTKGSCMGRQNKYFFLISYFPVITQVCKKKNFSCMRYFCWITCFKVRWFQK